IFDNHNLFSHGHSDEIQFRIVTKDNKIKWLHHLCQPVIKNNEYLGSRVSNIEITKLKNTEFELSKLSEELKKVNKSLYEMVHQRTVEITTFMTQCPYPRAVYDISGKLVSSNPAWNNELKLRNGKENIYDNPLIKYSKLESKIKKVFETGEKFKSHPIYYEQFDKMLILDFYSIKNRKEEIEIIVMNVEDITEQTRSEALSKEIETRKDLIGEIFDFLDAERRNISKELHDRIGQNLMLIKLNAELIKDANLYAPEKSDEIVELTIDTTKAIKQIIHSLYPEEIEKYGLKESIKNMVNRISKLTPINIDLNFRGQYIPLNKRQELAIFRVIQETLNNATRHSKAENISIDIQFTSNMLLGIITDNGIGFRKQSSDSTKFGIKFMEERMENIGGYFELNSRLKEGTTVHLEVPIG
ncbi:sensor histidine kinase, partial [Candidatus Woesearchaeota archaeon]|nr:sensor histidine kinase [Candidatus Woesearchaeota archaeon]